MRRKRCSGSRKRVRRRQKKRVVVLPQELIIEILLRLPVKSLVQFKCVSKSWLSFISDPHFAKSHFEGDAVARTERLLFIAVPSLAFPKIQSIDFNAPLSDDSACAVSFPVEFLPRRPHYLRISGSCRGFILLNYDQTLCVWNPCTGVHRIVYSSPAAVVSCHLPFLHGIGYDPLTDDYLVVQVSCNPFSSRRPRRVSCVEFFSLRANAWKQIESATHLSYERMRSTMNNKTQSETGLLLKGAIHWLAVNCDVSNNVSVAFDLTERSLSEIPLPVTNYLAGYYVYLLGVLGDLLSLSFVRQYYSLEIWVMKEYKMQSSWTKTFVLSADRMPVPRRFFFPVCYTKSGDLVVTEDCTMLAKFNHKGLLQEHRSYWYLRYNYEFFQSHVAVCTESLLSLPCDSHQAGRR